METKTMENIARSETTREIKLKNKINRINFQ